MHKMHAFNFLGNVLLQMFEHMRGAIEHCGLEQGPPRRRKAMTCFAFLGMMMVVMQQTQTRCNLCK
jgi:hypothetical protein